MAIFFSKSKKAFYNGELKSRYSSWPSDVGQQLGEVLYGYNVELSAASFAWQSTLNVSFY